MPINAITVILRVADLDVAREYYTTCIGLKVESANGPFVFLDAGTISIALHRLEMEAPPGEPDSRIGYTEIVFEADDVEAEFKAMRDRGVAFLAEAPRAVTSDGARDLLAAPFRDPDGHLLSITGWRPRG